MALGPSEQVTYPPTHGERLALADRYAVLPAGSHRAARRAGLLFLCRCLSRGKKSSSGTLLKNLTIADQVAGRGLSQDNTDESGRNACELPPTHRC